MVRRPYERAGGCKWCGRPVTMVPVGYDDWDAIENGRMHVCPKRPKDWRSSLTWWIATSNKKERRRLAAKCAFVVVLLLIALTLLVR
jgi:hypothetical protein